MATIYRVPELIEGAVDRLVTEVQANIESALLQVAQSHLDPQTGGSDGIDTPVPDPDRYYISELIEPLRVPSIFVIADRSEHLLERGQQFFDQAHTILVGVVTDDAQSVLNLTRKVWRYAQALIIVLHDQNLGPLHVLVESVDYSPVLVRGTAQERVFRKDATLRCKVMHLEAFN